MKKIKIIDPFITLEFLGITLETVALEASLSAEMFLNYKSPWICFQENLNESVNCSVS